MVRGLGCGHVLAPVLEQLDRIDGVAASSANHTGTLLRLWVSAGTDLEQVAPVVEEHLARDGRKPVRLQGADRDAALDHETWRTKDQIGELTAIEFRTLALDRVKHFIRAETVADHAADRLLGIAAGQWDRLARQADLHEPRQLPHRIDWKRRCQEFATALIEEAGGLLTGDQRHQLRQRVESYFRELLGPAR